jgi:hypothetical protein
MLSAKLIPPSLETKPDPGVVETAVAEERSAVEVSVLWPSP